MNMPRTLLGKLRRALSPHGWRIKVKKQKWRRIGGLGGTPAQYKLRKEDARRHVHQKLEEFNRHYHFTYHKVAIRNQKSRWGSCSKKGNLNFNYRIIDLPEALADYIIVHELCHLAEFNHSKKFWALVAQTIPDHKKRRDGVRKFLVEKNKAPTVAGREDS